MLLLSSSTSQRIYQILRSVADDDIRCIRRNKVAHVGRQARLEVVFSKYRLRQQCFPSAFSSHSPGPVTNNISVLDEESRQAEVSSALNSVELRALQTLKSGRAHKLLHGLADTNLPGVEDLSPELVKRLIADNLSQKPPLNIGRKGVWDGLVQDIHARWSTREVVKLRARHTSIKGDMKDTAKELELASGGIVIWRSGSNLLLYRGYEMDRTAQLTHSSFVQSMQAAKDIMACEQYPRI